MPKFVESIRLQGTELQDAVLQNSPVDLASFHLKGRMYWDSRNVVGSWVTPPIIPGFGPTTTLLDYPNVGRIRYWSEPGLPVTTGSQQPQQYATVATLWDLDRLVLWAETLVSGTGLSVCPYSVWGNNTASVNGGLCISPVVDVPTLQIPVALLSANHTDIQTLKFQKAYFYGKLTGNAAGHKTFTFTHGMNTYDLVVSIREASSNKVIEADVTFPTLNSLVIKFGNAPANAAIFYVIAVGVGDMDPIATTPGTNGKASYYVAATTAV